MKIYRVFLPLLLAVTMARDNGVANVKSYWEDGKFVVASNDLLTPLITVDGVNNTVDIDGVTVSGGITLDVGAENNVRTNAVIVPDSTTLSPIYNTNIFIETDVFGLQITLGALPANNNYDGADISILNTTIVTMGTSWVDLQSGFFNGGTYNKATFAGAVGDRLDLRIYNGNYWIVGSSGVTLSTVP